MAVRVGPPDPVMTLAEAQAHLRVDAADDQDYINALIGVVTEFLEGFRGTLGRNIIGQEWEEVYPTIGQGFSLPVSPVVSVESITHSGGAISNFVLSESGGVWRVSPDGAWPETVGDVVVRFKSGLSPVPSAVKMAAKLHLGTLYENRESVVVGTITSELPHGYNALLAPLRIWNK